MKKILNSPIAHLLLVVVLGTIAYTNTFQVPFEFDDLESIVNNPVITSLGNFLPGGSIWGFQPRRWVGYLSFALNYRLGGLEVTGYHLVNLLVHLSAALLVYTLVRLTFRTPRLVESRVAGQGGMAALLSALFFVIHPMQTQAVTYVVQRLTSLATLFYVAAMVLYASARDREERSGGITKSPLLIAASVAAALLAMQTKEIAFTLPFAAGLYELCFFRGAWKARALRLLPLLLTLPVVPLGVLLFPGNSVTEAAARLASPGAANASIQRLDYLFTQFRVIATYLRLSVLPIGQNVDYDYPLYTSFLAPPVLLSFLLLAALLGAALWLFRASESRAAATRWFAVDPAFRLVSFGILWFFLALSVESTLLPIADIIFEHRLYLPSVGLASALAVAVLLAAEKSSAVLWGRIPVIAAALAIGALSIATYQRNEVWGSNVRLWEDTVRKSPGKARPWYNLGTYLTDGGTPDAAVPVLRRALELDAQNADAWHNLGRAYLMLGRKLESLQALGEAVRLKPDMDNAVVNLSAALLGVNRPAEVIPLLEPVRQRNPNWAEPRLNLGLAYCAVGNLPAARGELAFLQQFAPHLTPLLASLVQGPGGAAFGR